MPCGGSADAISRVVVDVIHVELRSSRSVSAPPVAVHNQPSRRRLGRAGGGSRSQETCIAVTRSRIGQRTVDGALTDLDAAALAPPPRCAADVPVIQPNGFVVSVVRRQGVRPYRSRRHVDDMYATSNPNKERA